MRTRTVCVKGTEVIAKKSYSAARLAFTESTVIPIEKREKERDRGEEREREREKERESRIALKLRTLLFTEMQIHGLITKPFSNAHYLQCEGFANTRRALSD